MKPVFRNSLFEQWDRATNNTKISVAESTHLKLSGGKTKIEDENRLLELLAEDMKLGNPNYLIEKRTEVFRLCQDYDFLSRDQEGVSIQSFYMYMKTVQGVISEMFPDSEQKIVVCTAPKKQQEATVTHQPQKNAAFNWTNDGRASKPRELLTKTGFHVIFPSIYVNKEMAVKVRFALLQKMQEKYPGAFTVYENRPAPANCQPDSRREMIVYDTWDSVLDMTIYTANGLRMLGSSKASKCKQCPKRKRGTPRLHCQVCSNAGYLDQGRPYEIFAVLDKFGQLLQEETNQLQDDHLKALQMTTIRCSQDQQPTGNMQTPDWFTLEDDVQETIAKMQGVRHKHKRRAPQIEPALWGEPGSVSNYFLDHRRQHVEGEVIDPETDPRGRIFADLLRTNVTTDDDHLDITKMVVFPEKETMWAVVENAKCANVNRIHSNQHVYYQYTPRLGIVQRCFSSKLSNDRLHGPCNGLRAKQFFNQNAIHVNKYKKRELFPPIQVRGSHNQLTIPDSAAEALELSNTPQNRNPRVTAEDIQYQLLYENQFKEYRDKSLPHRFSWFDQTSVLGFHERPPPAPPIEEADEEESNSMIEVEFMDEEEDDEENVESSQNDQQSLQLVIQRSSSSQGLVLHE